MMEKRLYRSRSDRMLWGVCGGLAKYFAIDPTIVRVIFILTIFFNGIGILAYIILAIVVPQESSETREPSETVRENVTEMKETAEAVGKELKSTFDNKGKPAESISAQRSVTVLGIVILVIGILLLLTNVMSSVFWWFHSNYFWPIFWPLLLITIGVLIIISRRRKS
jgi:phage shock protein PspC (stress-responsive transcriptional regulator)